MVLQSTPSSQGELLQTQTPSFSVPPDASHKSAKVGSVEELDLESEEFSTGSLWFPQAPVMVLQSTPSSQDVFLQTQMPSLALPPDALHKSSKVRSVEGSMGSDSGGTSEGLLWFPQTPVMVLQTAPLSQRSLSQMQIPSFALPPEATHRSAKVSSVGSSLDLESLDFESGGISVGLLWLPQIPVTVLQTAPTSQSSFLQTQTPSLVVPPEALHSSVNFLSSSLVMDEELTLLLLDDFSDSSLETGIQFSLWQ